MTPEMIKLRDLAANRQPEERTARRIVRDAGLREERIVLEGTATDRWDAILREALVTGKLPRLLDTLLAEREDDSEMAQAVAAVRTQEGGTSPGVAPGSWRRWWPVAAGATAVLAAIVAWGLHKPALPISGSVEAPGVSGSAVAPGVSGSAVAPPPPIEGNSSVRFIYYRLRGRAVDQFLGGTFRTEKGPPVIIIENDSVARLRAALRTAGVASAHPEEGYSWTAGESERGGDELSDAEQDKLRSSLQFRESGADYNSYLSYTEFSAHVTEERAKALTAAGEWHVKRAEGGRPFLWRYADRDVLKDLQLPLYHQLTAGGVPRHFLVATLFGQPGTGGQCPGLPRGLVIAAPSRTIELEAAVLQNISDKPIQLGEVGLREGREAALRDAAEDERALADAPLVKRVLYAPRQIRPNEQVGLLLRVTLRYPAQPGRLATELLEMTPVTEPGKFTLLSPQPEENAFGYSPFNTRKVEVSLSSIAPAEEPDFTSTILFGRTTRLETIDVDGRVHVVRRDPDGQVAFIQNGAPGASCPHVYTRNAASGAWVAEGTILAGHVGKGLEGEDAMRLSQFDGRISIREEEDETSFLDEVYVDVESAGKTRRVWATEPLLRARDDRHLVLHKGERVDLSFPLEPGESVATLVAFGYYEITSPEAGRSSSAGPGSRGR